MSQHDMPERIESDTNTDSSGPTEGTAAMPPRDAQNAAQDAEQLGLIDMGTAWDEGPTELLDESEAAPVLQIGSTTLSRLDKSSRPIASTVCETCPAAVWYARGKKVQCYCRIMHLISWETGEANPITLCDGPAIASQ